MVNKLSKPRNGFTMLEMLVTLIIVAAILLLTSMSSRQFQQRQIDLERHFWQTFDNYWQQALFTARHEHRETEIRMTGTDAITFRSNRKTQTLKLPDSMSVKGDYRLTIRKDATISPQTVTLLSSAGNWRYKMIIQMGWGIYRIERETY